MTQNSPAIHHTPPDWNRRRCETVKDNYFSHIFIKKPVWEFCIRTMQIKFLTNLIIIFLIKINSTILPEYYNFFLFLLILLLLNFLSIFIIHYSVDTVFLIYTFSYTLVLNASYRVLIINIKSSLRQCFSIAITSTFI